MATALSLVHAAYTPAVYARYRKRMLEAGAQLYELDPIPSEALALASDVMRLIDPLMAHQACQVWLDANGTLRWSSGEPDAQPLAVEPRTTFWERQRLDLLWMLVPESVL